MNNLQNSNIFQEAKVACPFFKPMEKLETGEWRHVALLPLGCGWSGQCTAPGHEGEIPSPQELVEFCNLGYAENCSRLPQERLWDSVRFAARPVGNPSDPKASANARIDIRYICERGHRPAEHGFLEFNSVEARWNLPHRDERLQRLAECFLASFLERNKLQEAAKSAVL